MNRKRNHCRHCLCRSVRKDISYKCAGTYLYKRGLYLNLLGLYNSVTKLKVEATSQIVAGLLSQLDQLIKVAPTKNYFAPKLTTSVQPIVPTVIIYNNPP